MILKGRTISKGKAEGEVLKLIEPLSFLGDINVSTGNIRTENVGIHDKVLVFPRGKGSTVGSYVMYDLKIHQKAPLAIINSSAETIIATGAVISSIPMVDSVNLDLIMNKDHVIVNADEGLVEIKNVEVKELISSAIIIDKNILLFKQPEWHNVYPKKWGLYTSEVRKNETIGQAAIKGIIEKAKTDVVLLKKWRKHVIIRKNQTVWKIHFLVFNAKYFIPKSKYKGLELRTLHCSQSLPVNIAIKMFEKIKRSLDPQS